MNDRTKPEVPLYKGRLDTVTATVVSHADYLYDLVEPHFAYYPHDVFLSKRDGELHIEVYDEEAYDFVLNDLKQNFAEEFDKINVSLLKA